MAALLPFAKASDLLVLAPAVSGPKADLLLDLVSGTIRSSLRWDVDQQVDAVYTQRVRPGAYLEAVVLPALNLVSIKTNGLLVDDVVQPTTAFDATAAGVVYLRNVARKSVSVTYTAGYVRAPVDTAPSVLRTVALDYAARLANNPSGVQAYAMGGTSETFGVDLSELADNDHRLDPYRVDQ